MNFKNLAVLSFVLSFIALGGVIGVYVAVKQAQEDGDATQKTAQIATCNRGNVARAISRNDERQRVSLTKKLGGSPEAIAQAQHGVTIKDKLQPILNCEATFQGRRTVALRPSEQAKYLAIVREGRTATISEAGAVIR